MTDTLQEHADPTLHKGEPLVEMMDVGKTYGAIRALKGINLEVNAGEVTCVLGDNGAGKSTLIKIISGLHPHNEGTVKVDGEEVHFGSPRESLEHGIATVYQDLAVVSLMEVWRNFFLGSEVTGSKFPLSPKATVAFELSGQADGGANQGTYLELGIRPAVKLIDGKYPLSLAMPVKTGLSLKDYYEGVSGDSTFGYFDTGAVASVAVALGKTTLDIHGGIDLLWLGDTTKRMNIGNGFKPVGMFGVGISY